jgi:glutamate-ammonia-ligase adenylyltransferase
MSVALLRELAEHSAAPAAVAVAADRLAESLPGVELDPEVAAAVVAVFGASRSLTAYVLAEPREALRILARLDERVPLAADDETSLVAWRRREFLRIAARDLLGRDRLEATGEALAALATDVLEAACRLAGAAELAVIGMGKVGGRELNYASDVDVVFVGGRDADARAVMRIARRCFRVDADLRPEGRDGPLTRSLASWEAYWERWAQPWEFQALLKARPVAGNPALGAAFAESAARHLWTRPFSADDIRSLRAMKARAEGIVARKGLHDREVKRGRGGIRDIEFAIQLLQLVHGRNDPGLRSPNTLEALAELSGAGYVDPADAGALEDAYRFLRTVEHRLQLVDESQVHAVPADAGARARLARVMGFAERPDASAVEQFDDALRRHQATARTIHERLYFRPLLEAFAGAGRLTPEAAEERLAAFGFREAERTRTALRELTRGLTRASRLMQQFLPLLLEWLSDSPDPDLGLLGLRNMVSGPQRVTELVTAFRDSPETARRLCLLLGTSPVLADTLLHNPDLVGLLDDPSALAPLPRDALLAACRAPMAWRDDDTGRARGLVRAKRREELRIAARDVFGEADLDTTEAALTALAEAVVAVALEALAPPVPMAVVAMGRFGGAELSYASDLDVLFVTEAGADGVAAAERTAERLLRFLNGSVPTARIYAIDARLRPEGTSGPLVRTVESYRAYYERWGAVWERQALVRARPVAGDPELAARFMAVVDEHVWGRPLTHDEVREIRRIKARVERERIPAGEDPQFHLKLGRGSLSDVEWTVQLLQLLHGVRSTGTMAALVALRDAGVLDARDAAVLADAYRFCERTRNRWYLVKGGPGDSLPTAPEQLGRLARSLDTTPSELREHYRRVTRRARHVVERLFYGRT